MSAIISRTRKCANLLRGNKLAKKTTNRAYFLRGNKLPNRTKNRVILSHGNTRPNSAIILPFIFSENAGVLSILQGVNSISSSAQQIPVFFRNSLILLIIFFSAHR
jgi:hypothetical protein